MSKITFDWDKPVDCKHTDEAIVADSLGRAKYAEYLTSYLSGYKNASYVLNLDCAWGTGKTWFLKRWANTIGHKHPVIYLDAWKNDNHNEPLLLVLSKIIEQLKTLLKGDKNPVIDSLYTKSAAVIKAIAPELAKGLVKKLVNFDLDKVTDNVKAADSKVEENAASLAVKELLSLHHQQNESIDALKLTVEKLLSDVVTDDNADGEKRWSPMYIFIDELDRCRPTFAIELLEVVKHIFSMQRVIFVIATDTEQLQHSIRAVYGSGFDSQKYLMRFFDRSFTLPAPKTTDFVGTLSSTALLQARMLQTNDLNIFAWDDQNTVAFLAFIFEGFSLDLRSIGQIVERVAGVLRNHEEEQGVIWLVVLECMRIVLPEGYKKMLAGEVSFEDINQNDSFENIIERPLNKIARNNNYMKDHTIPMNKSAKHREAELGSVNRNVYETDKRRLKDMGGSMTFHLLLERVSMRYSLEKKYKVVKVEVGMVEAYIWKTEANNINRFRDYVEIASNLS